MIPRLHVDVPLAEGAVVALVESQAHYLRSVLRRDDGDPLLLFNARDGEFRGSLAPIGKRAAAARIIRHVRSPSIEPDVWLVFAGVKRAAVETIVQKGTELGVARFLPALTERTQRDRVNDERLAAIAVEAAEQSMRLSVPSFAPSASLAAILDGWPSGRRLYFCDESGDDADAPWGGRTGRAAPFLEAVAGSAPAPAAILIGPEGGFAPGERSDLRMRAFVTPVSLGPRILRADTAAIAALTLWQAVHGDLKES